MYTSKQKLFTVRPYYVIVESATTSMLEFN